MRYSVRIEVRLFYERISRILAWLPVLWRDNDFTGDSMAAIVAFKLRRLADVIDECKSHPSCEKDARDIRACAEHLRRFQYPDLRGEATLPGVLSPNAVPDEPMRFESVPGSKYRRLIPPSKKMERWGKRDRSLRDAHWDTAWEMFRTHGRSWWD